MVDIGKLMLDQFKAPEVSIDCARCRRHATVTVAVLKKKFGNQRLDVIARMVARSSAGGLHNAPCALADDPFERLCSARPIELNPVLWARVIDAEKGGWTAKLHCHRRLENLKRAKSCAETVELPVLVLKALFGWDFELEKLPRRMRCPHCGSQTIEIEWRIPAEAPDPGGATDDEPAPVLQLRPTRAAMGRKRFRVIEERPKRQG